ncbi:glycerophosphodiester phosphodiesterase [Haloplanus sp. GCM10025708]|uniref:glycerophosphodiester phosphodiesterase n=1 Tax=Haloferacaceae TaxID=1644056 RepID=UPI00360FC8E0
MVTPAGRTADVATFAHRGFAGIAPENTLAAARLASRLGADAIECDVVTTADGTPVVFHDSRLDDRGPSRGITDATGAVAERSTSTVTNTHVLGTRQLIPTLSAFVETVPEDVALNVELKQPGTTTGTSFSALDGEAKRDQWLSLAERVVDILGRRPNEVLVSSFSETALEAVRSLSPDARVAPLARDLDTVTTMATSIDTEIIHPAIEGLRSAANERPPSDYTVNAWTARTWQDAHDAVQFGVDGLIADYPNVLSTTPEWGPDRND